MGKRKNNKKQNIYEVIVAIFVIAVFIYGYINQNVDNFNTESIQQETIIDIEEIPEYSSNPYVEINNNIPDFKEEDYTLEPFENYSEYDKLGRSGVAFANICKEIMPKEGEERGEIGNIKDLSGWVQKRYDHLKMK